MPFPEKGIPREELLARMRERKRADADWRGGRTFSLVYPAGEDVDAVLHDAAELYLFETLNPFASRACARWRTGGRARGRSVACRPRGGRRMTSGGTERAS